MTPGEIQSLASELLASHGLTTRGWRFKFNNRRRAFGVCSYREKVIALSLGLCQINSDARIKATLLHEVAHALTPGADHGPIWKLQAMALGCDPNATCHDAAMLPGRYFADCGCMRHYMYARPKVSTRRWHACGRCRQRLVWLDSKTGQPVPASPVKTVQPVAVSRPFVAGPGIAELYDALTGR